MKLINIGFGNMVSASRLVAIVSPESAPIKRIIQDAKDRGTLIDATYGRRPESTTSCTLEIVRASADQASYLDIITGDPMFYMNAYFLDAKGKPLVIGRQYIVGSRFVFNI